VSSILFTSSDKGTRYIARKMAVFVLKCYLKKPWGRTSAPDCDQSSDGKGPAPLRLRRRSEPKIGRPRGGAGRCRRGADEARAGLAPHQRGNYEDRLCRSGAKRSRFWAGDPAYSIFCLIPGTSLSIWKGLKIVKIFIWGIILFPP
jgi:hypothetical protein